MAGFEIYLRNINTVYSKKLSGLLNNADSIKILIVGNSHACYGVSPSQFYMNTFNIAQSNQSIYFDKRITLKYIDKLVNLKYVLISVDFHSFYFSSQGIRDAWSYYSYHTDYKDQLPLLSKLSYLNGYTPGVAISFLRKHLFTNQSFNVPVELEDGEEYFDDENRGWIVFNDTDWNSFNQNGYRQRSMAFNNTIKNSRENMEVLFDLDDFIVAVKSKGVTPILVTLPVFNEFYPYLNNEILPRNKLAIQRLCNLHSIQYFDFSDT